MDTLPYTEPQEGNTEVPASPAPAPLSYGGLGEDALGKRNHRSNSDVRIMARAIREEWDISPEKRVEVIDTLYHEMRHSGSPHLRIMAARAIVAANAQNIAARNEGKQGVTVNIRELVLQAGQQLTSAQTITSPTPLTNQG